MSFFEEPVGPTNLFVGNCSFFPTSKLVGPTVREQLFGRKKVPDQQAGRSYRAGTVIWPKKGSRPASWSVLRGLQ